MFKKNKKQTIEFKKKIGSGKTIEIFYLRRRRKNQIRFGQIKWLENVSFQIFARYMQYP